MLLSLVMLLPRGLILQCRNEGFGCGVVGGIPAHWEVKRLKFAASFYGGGTPFKENLEYWSGNIPWVSPKDMKSEIINDSEDHITKKAIENSSTRLVKKYWRSVGSGSFRHTEALNSSCNQLAAYSFEPRYEGYHT